MRSLKIAIITGPYEQSTYFDWLHDQEEFEVSFIHLQCEEIRKFTFEEKTLLNKADFIVVNYFTLSEYSRLFISYIKSLVNNPKIIVTDVKINKNLAEVFFNIGVCAYIDLKNLGLELKQALSFLKRNQKYISEMAF